MASSIATPLPELFHHEPPLQHEQQRQQPILGHSHHSYRVQDPNQDRPFLCPFANCGGRFHRKFTLHEHMKTHTGEQPHQCPIKSCGKRFSTSGNLARHKRLHALHKMECPVAGCTRIFTSQEMLAKHQKVHAGSAVHSCVLPGCGKTFSTAGNLTRHMKTQHGLTNTLRRYGRQQHYANNNSPTTTSFHAPSSIEPPMKEYPREAPVSSGVFTPSGTTHAHHFHPRSQFPSQPPNQTQLPKLIHHKVTTASGGVLSDQDLHHLFECLF
uniref:C2H2-type domain-containing protein n=1 Tax=Globisporangium ultimum (strain ATCC 200006 / CBS 805.95 / DAOM BR144) TaxID=431595 RepID=K3WF63_GLOUD